MDFHTSRAELYEEAINALLKKWDSTRRIKRFEPYKKLSPSRKRALFSQIAAQTFEKGKYFLKRKEIVDLIIAYIRHLPDIDQEEIKDTAEGIFDAIVANHGILFQEPEEFTPSHILLFKNTLQQDILAKILPKALL